MPVTLNTVRGDSLVFDCTFFSDSGGTVPWNDVGDFSPVLQVRLSTNSEAIVATAEAAVTDNVIRFSVPSSTTEDWNTCTYYWDIEFTDPDADPGLGVFTWPGAGDERNKMVVTNDITKVAAP